MKKLFLTLVLGPITIASAQDAAPGGSQTPAISNSTPAAAADVQELRTAVQSLTETVKALQQQVKDQQTIIEKAHLTGEEALPSPEMATVTKAGSPSSAPVEPTPFPTTDSSVVSSAQASSPGVDANGAALPGAFPTTDASTTIRNSADSTRVTSSSRSTVRSIPISKVLPTSFSSWTTTTKPKSKLRKCFCKRPTCLSISN
jgi:hypothetical protein